MVHIHINHNYFNFTDPTFQQTQGTAMGQPSPLSSANIMSVIIRKFLAHNPRYMYSDDISILFTNNKDCLDSWWPSTVFILPYISPSFTLFWRLSWLNNLQRTALPDNSTSWHDVAAERNTQHLARELKRGNPRKEIVLSLACQTYTAWRARHPLASSCRSRIWFQMFLNCRASCVTTVSTVVV